MKTLFLNTSSQLTSIAVFDEESIVDEEHWPSEQNESQTLMPAVEKLLKDNSLSPNDIDRLLVCVGPGGFTSCRIGVSAGNAWSFAKQVPVSSCSVFDLYEEQAGRSLLFSANPKEAWLKRQQQDPEFIHAESLPEFGDDHVAGALSNDWLEILQALPVEVEQLEQGYPNPELFEYSMKPILPWYFKNPNITWSKKINPSS